MKKLKLFALTAVALMGVTGVANAETVMLAQDDFVGISFWLVSMACLASTVFFFLERSSVPAGMESFYDSCWSSNWVLHSYTTCT